MDLVKWVQGSRRDLGNCCVSREQELRLHSLEERRLRRSHLKCLIGRVVKTEPWAQTEIRETLLKEKRILFLCEDSQTMAQVAERGCGASILGDTQSLTGHVALASGPCSEQEMQSGDLQRSLSTSVQTQPLSKRSYITYSSSAVTGEKQGFQEQTADLRHLMDELSCKRLPTEQG